MPAGEMIDRNDPACKEIVARAMKLGITGDPDRASHDLGTVTLASGRMVRAFVLHAIDPIITDGENVVMINRRNEPGRGRPALPGGVIDPTENGVETGIEAAIREAGEEVGLDISGAKATPVGTRNMNRPYDVRVAYNDKLKEKFGVAKGDVFMVSTQAVRFDVPGLSSLPLNAGDDAEPGSARLMRIESLNREVLSIGDHLDMIMAAFPDKFPKAVSAAGPRP